jgi:Bacterial regulatory protein, arsR family
LFQEGYRKSSHATPDKFEHERMQQMNTMMQQNQIIEWRRAKVMELLSKGETNQSEIARILQVDKSIICRDIAYLRQQAKENIKKYIDERLPEEYEKCMVGLTAILREAWTTSQQTEDKREKMQALSLAKDCYSMKLDLLTNATVVDDAIRFVEGLFCNFIFYKKTV